MTLTQEQLAAVIRRSDPRALFGHEAECWQAAIDSCLIWHLEPQYGQHAVKLIAQGVLTLARRSYCRSPKPTSLGSPRPLPERRKHMRVPVT